MTDPTPEAPKTQDAPPEAAEVASSMPIEFRSFIFDAIYKAGHAEKDKDKFNPVIDAGDVTTIRAKINEFLQNAYSTENGYLIPDEIDLIKNATAKDFEDAKTTLLIEDNLEIFSDFESDFDEQDMNEFMGEFHAKFLAKLFEILKQKQSGRTEEAEATQQKQEKTGNIEKLEHRVEQLVALTDLPEDLKPKIAELQKSIDENFYQEVDGKKKLKEDIDPQLIITLTGQLKTLYVEYLTAKQAPEAMMKSVQDAEDITKLEEAITNYEESIKPAEEPPKSAETPAATPIDSKNFLQEFAKDPWKIYRETDGLFKWVAGFLIGLAGSIPFLSSFIFKNVSTEDGAKEGWEIIKNLADGKKSSVEVGKEALSSFAVTKTAAVTWLKTLKADGNDVYTEDANTDFANSIFNTRFTIGDLKGFTGDDPSKIKTEKIATDFQKYSPALQAIFDKVVVGKGLLQDEQHDSENLAKYIETNFKSETPAAESATPAEEQVPS